MRVHVHLPASLTRIVTLPPLPRLRFQPRDYSLSTQRSLRWTRMGAWPRTFGCNRLNGHVYVRVLVFFVWQCREAPKEWPWLMKNQRWVSSQWIEMPVYSAWFFLTHACVKIRSFPHVPLCLFAKLQAEIQLLAVPTLIDRKVCERASNGARTSFCLITHSQPAGVIPTACLISPVCVCVRASMCEWLVPLWESVPVKICWCHWNSMNHHCGDLGLTLSLQAKRKGRT